MYLYKKFKNREIEFLSAITWKHDWTLGITLHWNWITKADDYELCEDCFFFDVHILCFEFTFNYYKDRSSLSSK